MGLGHFLPLGYNMKNLGSGPLDEEASHKIKRPGPSDFRRDFLKAFAIYPLYVAMATRVLHGM